MIKEKMFTINLIKMFENLFSGKYDAFKFSIDFPDYCFTNYDNLEKEYIGLGYYLDQNIPDICDEGEIGFDSTNMIAKLKKVYDVVLEMVNGLN